MNAPPLLPPRPHLHPAILIAAAAVSAFALAGIGVLTGVIPSTFGTAPVPLVQTTETAPAAAASAAAAAAAPAETVVPAAAPAAAAAPAVKPAKLARAAAPRDGARKTAAAEGSAKTSVPAPAAVCKDCGRIESIREIAHAGDASGLGAVAGGVVGAVLGNQVGGGRGKSAATLLGGIGGAVAGHQIEKSRQQKFSYEIVVRFDDGTSQVLTQEAPPSWRQGDRVKMVNGTLNAGD